MSVLITAADAKAICKLGEGSPCCRYLVCGAEGFECAKHSEFRALIDARVAAGTFNAKGDNCEGRKPTP